MAGGNPDELLSGLTPNGERAVKLKTKGVNDSLCKIKETSRQLQSIAIMLRTWRATSGKAIGNPKVDLPTRKQVANQFLQVAPPARK